MEVRRDAVEEYALEDASTMDNMLSVSREVGSSEVSMDWKRSGYLESGWNRQHTRRVPATGAGCRN